ncbi:MAG: S-adenosylmethionine:tRNA ribosyltransferase-isomerase, partial [Candidatus Uhrbacteria bacterium]
MSTPISDYYYDLPVEFIAQEPVEPRDQSKLLVLDRANGIIKHQHFFEIGQFLRDDDLLVFNDTKVFKARLVGEVAKVSGVAKVEVFLLRAHDRIWQAMIRPGRRVDIGDTIRFKENLFAQVIEKKPNGIVKIEFNVEVDEVLRYCDQFGEVPVPPYVKQQPDDLEMYQTVYARETGSVAAPTAGFHFTQRLLDELR